MDHHHQKFPTTIPERHVFYSMLWNNRAQNIVGMCTSLHVCGMWGILWNDFDQTRHNPRPVPLRVPGLDDDRDADRWQRGGRPWSGMCASTLVGRLVGLETDYSYGCDFAIGILWCGCC